MSDAYFLDAYSVTLVPQALGLTSALRLAVLTGKKCYNCPTPVIVMDWEAANVIERLPL